MILSSNYSRVILSARGGKGKERLPGPVLMEVTCYSSGQHGRGDYPDVPAGDPLTRGSTSWSIMDMGEEDLPELEKFVGSSVQIWTGDWWGSYHERSLTVFLVAPGLPIGFSEEVRSPELVGEFPFRSIKRSCEELIARLNLIDGPWPDDLPKLDVPESPEGFSGEGSEEAPRPSIETPDKPKPGETSQQYWDRVRQEKTGKYPYKYSGD